MLIKKTNLLEALKKCLPGVEKGSPVLEGSDSFVFAGGAVHSYNDSISVSVQLDLGGIIAVVKSKELFRLVSKFKGEELEIVVDEDAKTLKLLGGNTKASMKLLESTVTRYLSGLKLSALEWNTLPEGFMEALKLCRMPSNNTPMRGIFVAKDVMYSTDTIRMNRHKLKSAVGPLYIDEPATAELMKVGKVVEIATGSSWFHFRTEDGTIFSAKKKDPTNYPQEALENILSTVGVVDDSATEGVFPNGLREVVDRVAVLSSAIQGAQAVRLTLRKDTLLVSSESSSGSMEEAIEWASPFADSFASLELWVDSAFLIEVCGKVMNFFIKQQDTGTIIVFHNEEYTQLAAAINK